MKTFSSKIWLSAGSLLALSVSQAMAQEAAESAADDGALEEITVTAEKRTEDLQKTPLAITAVSADDLIQRGVDNAQQLQQVVPGLQVQPSGNGTNFTIRGIASAGDQENSTSSIGFGVDGVFLGRSLNTTSLLFDVDHVEVVRGPQGSLNGSSASGGSINIVTKRPTQTEEGAAAVEFGSYDTLKTQGMLNVPLSDTLALRASFGTARHDGYLKAAPAADLNSQDDKAGRVKLLWTPSESFDLMLSANYYNGTGTSFARPVCATVSVSSSGCPSDGYGFGNYGDAHHYSLPIGYVQSNDHTNWGSSLTFNWNLDFATLTYVGAYVKDLVLNSETTSQYTDNTDGSVDLTPVVAGVQQKTNTNEYQYSHELRLANKSGAYDWVVGLYDEIEHNHLNGGVSCGYANGHYSCSGIDAQMASSERAVFGQLTYSVTDALRVIGGARYNVTRKYATGDLIVAPDSSDLSSTVAIDISNPSFDQKFTTYRAGVQYDLAPSSLLYATYATGYKPAAYNSSTVPLALRYYKPEKLIDYEIGSKNRFLDDRLQVNVAAFYYDYSNLQITYSFSASAGGTVNAASATSKGLELSTIWAISRLDQVNFDANYLDAKYDDFVVTYYSGTTPIVADLTGNPLANAPKWVFNAGYEHRFELASGAAWTPHLDIHHESDHTTSFAAFAIDKQPEFTRADLTLGFQPAQGKWRAEAYVRNLTNEDYALSVGGNSFTPTTTSTAYFSDPRTYGVRMSVNF
ncbi:MAG: TonB-dependent receptor [Steroidobacteraceae bacterium]